MAETTKSRLLTREHSTLFSGMVPDTSLHAHAGITLIVSDADPFDIILESGQTVRTRSALLDCGVQHRLITRGQPTSVCFMEMNSLTIQQLRASRLTSRALEIDCLPNSLSRSARWQALSAEDWHTLFSGRWHSRSARVDERIFQGLHALGRQIPLMTTENPDASGLSGLDQLARSCGLSPSRFRHLFREQTGVSFTHYRHWQQLLGFMRQLGRNTTLTAHALDHGFFDSAHFSRTYRKMLGVTPSSIIRQLSN